MKFQSEYETVWPKPTLAPISNYIRLADAWLRPIMALKPTHFVTVRFNQGRFVKSPRGTAYVPYATTDYSAVARRIQVELSEKLLGRNVVRRHKRLVPMILSLEGGNNEWGRDCGDYHAHILVTCPPRVSDDVLRQTVKSLWARQKILKKESLNKAVVIGLVSSETFENLGKYIMKQGTAGLDPLGTVLPEG